MTENNRLIAEFMGRNGKINKSLYTWKGIDALLSGGWVPVEQMKFHSDWNWLMEVVEKINDLNNVVEIHENHVRVVNNERSEVLVDVVEGSMLEATYNACVEFVKLYNQNK